ncbi:MAG: peptidoglycan-associated lipoprotein Pal [Dinoroseobacter sp.]|nr:peptidoglycan-associated lipoprotein Pal [Dinoroseobacter sp.]
MAIETILSRRTAVVFAAVLALSGCAGQNGLFGSAGSGGAGGSGGIASGSISDPASPAYFQQAVGDRVLFTVDQSTLTNEARAILEQQAQWLTQNAAYTAVVEGHADEQGTREYNLALGARRASAVRDYLVDRGVADSRLSTVTYGKERPLEICSNESCYAQNRRAVTVLSAGPGS